MLLSILQTNKSLEGNRLTWEKAKAALKAHGCKSKGLKRYGLKDGMESARIMRLPSQERSLLCNDMYKHVAEQIEARGLTRPLTPEKSKRKPAGKSGDLKPPSDHALGDAQDEIPPSSRTGDDLSANGSTPKRVKSKNGQSGKTGRKNPDCDVRPKRRGDNGTHSRFLTII